MARKLTLILLVFFALVSHAQCMPKAAVYVMGNAKEDYKEIFGSRMVDALTQSGKYAVMERSAEILDMLNREMNYQLSGEVDEGQISQIGHKLGVDYVFIVDLSELNREDHFASIRSVDIRSGKIMASVYGKKPIKGLSDLTDMAHNLGSQLMSSAEPPRSGQKAAVYVSMSNSVDRAYQPIVETVMITGLTESAQTYNISLVERSEDFLHQLSSESNYQTSGEVSSDQIRALGRKFGVKYVYAVRVNEILGEYNLSARCINIESGQDMQTWSASGPVRTVEDIVDLTDDLARSSKGRTRSGGSNYGNRTFTVNGVSFDMVSVDGGQFNMGATYEQDEYDDTERPVHLVTLGSYMIGETEVTQELWQAVMGHNPSRFRGATRPVENVSWDDCQEFISRLNRLTGQNFRLPTEAEWEFAARGGNKAQNTKFSGSNNIYDVAWFYKNSSSDRGMMTHYVKSKKPNQLGIYDMSGNVREWCFDWYEYYNSNAQTSPKGPSSGSYRVVRGGSWYDSARDCRVSSRAGDTHYSRYTNFGLRLAL